MCLAITHVTSYNIRKAYTHSRSLPLRRKIRWSIKTFSRYFECIMRNRLEFESQNNLLRTEFPFRVDWTFPLKALSFLSRSSCEATFSRKRWSLSASPLDFRKRRRCAFAASNCSWVSNCRAWRAAIASSSEMLSPQVSDNWNRYKIQYKITLHNWHDSTLQAETYKAYICTSWQILYSQVMTMSQGMVSSCTDSLRKENERTWPSLVITCYVHLLLHEGRVLLIGMSLKLCEGAPGRFRVSLKCPPCTRFR